MKWLLAFLIISLLVLFHEFGHFIVARLNGVVVEEFSLGFGPRLLSAKRGETRYSLKLLLFGGSCRMRGMYDYEEDGADAEEGSFQAASLGRRAAIIFAGPLFNFLLAFILAVIVISFTGYDPAVITYVGEGSNAEKAGLLPGDLVTSFNGEHVDIGRDISLWELLHDLRADEEVRMTVQRDGEEHRLSFFPDTEKRYMLGMTYTPGEGPAVIQTVYEDSPLAEAGVLSGDVITEINGVRIGTAAGLSDYFESHPPGNTELRLLLERGGKTYEAAVTPRMREETYSGFIYNLGRVKTDVLGVLKYSVIEVRYWIVSTIRSVGAMFTGRFSVNDLSGPIGVADIVGETYEESKPEGPFVTLLNMLNLILFLSADIGVMNLLPIPVLDGGKLLFFLVEAIRGKPVRQNTELAIQTVAALLLMALMVYVMYHDLLLMFTR